MEQTEQFRKRITELADRAFSREIVTFSDFLDLNQLNILHGIHWKDRGVRLKTFGGYELAERQMAAFVPEALSYMTGNHSVSEYALSSVSNLSKMEAAPGWQYPFCVLEVQPLSAKYAEDLSHRDYLGSVLALGIERSKLGDLIVSDTSASIFCSDAIASFICQELTRVRHTDVTCTFSDADSVTIEPAFEERTGSVASLRLDSLIALTFGIPRARAAQAVSQGAVSVNAKIVTSNGHPPQDGDRISVRGLGKCRFRGVLHQTKKGRLIVRMERFV